MSEDADANFLMRCQSDGIANQHADRAATGQVLQLWRNFQSFGDYNNGEAFAVTLATGYIVANVLHGKRNFGDKDDMRSTGDPCLKGNPSSITTHDLDHHDAMVRLSGSVNLVNAFGRGVNRGVEAKRQFGSGEVVIDRLGNANNFHPFFEEVEGDFLGSIAADGDDGVNAQLGGVGDDLSRDVAHHFATVLDGFVTEGISAIGGAKNGSAARENAADIFERQLARALRPNESIEAIGNADHLPFVFEKSRLHGSADDSVQARSVSTPGADSDAADIRHDKFQRYDQRNLRSYLWNLGQWRLRMVCRARMELAGERFARRLQPTEL